MIMTQMMLKHEPGWTLECNGKKSYLRRDHATTEDDGLNLLPRKSQKVCFRCDVEVREYERDEPEDYHRLDSYYNYDHSNEDVAAAGGVETEDNNGGGTADCGSGSASPLAMCASCLAALCVTVILPWLLMSG
ncbi:hypothetical protein TKK_0002137 [Trichogramma kaykai]|uniref:Uncharacterized protein n=1 Tax=Trichogramma kaykai TaxID=54128 RepID=A0ABD2XBC9_9HYME